MRGKKMFHGVEIGVWAITCFMAQRDCPENSLRQFSQQLMRASAECGMPITSQPCFCKYAKRVEDVSTVYSLIRRGVLLNFP